MAPTPEHITIKEDWIREAILWVAHRLNYTIDRRGMNARTISEKLDDGIMGEIGSIALMQYLSEKGLEVTAYDQIRKDYGQRSDLGWDILIGRGIDEWAKSTDDMQIPPANCISLSVKTSRSPPAEARGERVDACIQKYGFKILKKLPDIGQDIKADYEVQVYFSLSQSKYSRETMLVEEKEISSMDINAIVAKLRISDRFGNCHIVGFGRRDTLIQFNNSLEPKNRAWSSLHDGQRKLMWSAPLWLGIGPETFVDITRS